MEKAASELNFIEAARYRDEMLAYKDCLNKCGMLGKYKSTGRVKNEIEKTKGEKVKLFRLICAKFILWEKYQIFPGELL